MSICSLVLYHILIFSVLGESETQAFVCLFIESILQCHPHSGFLSGFLDNFTCPPAYMPPVFPAALPAVALSAFP